jgi:8-oxo-dGTP pyrophosphatase MutT (NUDIX family)
MSHHFERSGSETIWNGHIGSVRVERYRYDDGREVTRENVHHPGAVGIVAVDDEHVWLVRQPREIVGVADLLEIPAGKLDVAGEAPLDSARRELAEEIGKGAHHWEPLKAFFTTPGFSDERIELFLATAVHDVTQPEIDEDERIEIVPWPLDRLDEAIAASEDAKTLVGLLLLRARRTAS